MDFWNSAVNIMEVLVIAYGAYLCVQGGIGLAEGFSQDNPSAKASGGKLLVAGGGVILIGIALVPKLSGLLSV